MKSPLFSRHLSRRLEYSSAIFPCCVDISWFLSRGVAKENYLPVTCRRSVCSSFCLSFCLSATSLLLPFSGLFVPFAMWLLSIRRSTCLHVSGLLVPNYTCQRAICPAIYLSAAYLSRIISVSGLLVLHYTCQWPTFPPLYLSAAYLFCIIPLSGLLFPQYACQRPTCPALYLSVAYLSSLISVGGLLISLTVFHLLVFPSLHMLASNLSHITVFVSGSFLTSSCFQQSFCPPFFLSAACLSVAAACV
jgi:hypothetical protein